MTFALLILMVILKRFLGLMFMFSWIPQHALNCMNAIFTMDISVVTSWGVFLFMVVATITVVAVMMDIMVTASFAHEVLHLASEM